MTTFGLLLPTREAVMNRSGSPDFGPILDLAAQAEAQDFHSVWVGDSILARPRFEPLLSLSALAVRTSRVRLGTAVLVSAMRNPVVLANEIANLDVISGGRLILGLGVGGSGEANVREWANVGRPFEHRGRLFSEDLALMCRLWSGEELSVDGPHAQLLQARLGILPIQQPHPPLWLGGSVDATFKRIVRLGDGWFPNAVSPSIVRSGWDRLTELAGEAGRNPNELHLAAYMTLVIDEDEARAEGQLRAFMEQYYHAPYEALARHSGLCAGNADRCARFVQGFVESGVETVVVRFGASDQHAQLERWSKQVAARLAAR